MNDDWRVVVDFEDSNRLESVMEGLKARELEHELGGAFADRLAVSQEGSELFLYAGTREQAEHARDFVLDRARAHGWEVEAPLTHWHPTAEEWEDPDKPLPDDDATRLAEHKERIAMEDDEATERGYPEFEVRIDFPSHHEAAEFADRLRDEGIPLVHRWKFVLVGASDEDVAKQLAERVEAEAPEGSSVKVEGTWKAAVGDLPPNPFAIFGGLGG